MPREFGRSIFAVVIAVPQIISRSRAFRTLLPSVTKLGFRGPLMLFFHGVIDHISDPRIQVLHAEAEGFARFLEALKKDFDVISLDQVAKTAPRDLPRNAAVISFDDGYANNLSVAAPLLEAFDCPYTVYLTTSAISASGDERLPTFIARVALYFTEKAEIRLPHVENTLRLRNSESRSEVVSQVSALLKSLPLEKAIELTAALYELLSDAQWSEFKQTFDSDRLMNWAEVRQLHDKGGSIGAHGHLHFPLHDQQSDEDLRELITVSKQEIENHLENESCRHYAFPNGGPDDISSRAIRMVKEAGFATAAATIPAFLNQSRTPYLLPRICAYDIESVWKRSIRLRLERASRDLHRHEDELLIESI